MKLRLILAGFAALATICYAHAQATNTGSTVKPPEVFLDNHRPLIKKREKAPTSRNVAGKVVDSSGQPLEGALVTLTNTKTSEKTTFITKTDGRYNFDDLSLTVDYQLQAHFKALSTETRKISQYDPNVNTVRMLQVDTDAKSGTAPVEAAKQDKKTPPQE